MIFYRAAKGDRLPWLSIGATRALTATSLLAYPLGGAILIAGPDGAGGLPLLEIAGLALIFISLIAAAPILGSQIQRIVGDEAAKLDEFELTLRQRTLSRSYSVFSAMILVVIFYAAVASDFGWWLPRSYDEFNALFWGAFLYSVLLPATILAWSKDAAGLA